MPELFAHIEEMMRVLPAKLRDRIFWVEGLTNEQLAYVYRNASLFLCTSGHEGYCLPVREALDLGVPVATFPQPAVEETLDGQGVVLPDNLEEAARELHELLSRKTPSIFFRDEEHAWHGVRGK